MSAGALIRTGAVDVVLHGGDISYAVGYEAVWDFFLNMLAPVASRVLYVHICVDVCRWILVCVQVLTYMQTSDSGELIQSIRLYQCLFLSILHSLTNPSNHM